jgi:hypothetical protein
LPDTCSRWPARTCLEPVENERELAAQAGAARATRTAAAMKATRACCVLRMRSSWEGGGPVARAR